jgi:hypothetical protein
MKESAIFRYDPFETVEHRTNLLQLGQLPTRDHEEKSARTTELIQGRYRRSRNDTVVGERSVVIASQRSIFHLCRIENDRRRPRKLLPASVT